MKHKASEAFLGNNIFLATGMAKTANNGGSAIQAVFLFALGCVAQNKFLLKISTKNTSFHFFFVTEQFNYFC
jgi:hypothetical protein